MVDWSKVGPDLFAKAVAHQNIASDVQSLHVVFKTNPTILASHPSRGDSFGSWVFSDRSAGLVDEPFVSGADTLIEAIAKQGGFLEKAKKTGVVAAFSASEFTGALVCLVRDQREDPNGNWYTESKTGHRAWLCPALYHYFSEAPKKLWINIWHV
jgi:hypothetical protein